MQALKRNLISMMQVYRLKLQLFVLQFMAWLLTRRRHSGVQWMHPGTADCLSTWLIPSVQKKTDVTETRVVSLGDRELNERNQSAPRAVEGAAEVRAYTWTVQPYARLYHGYCMPRVASEVFLTCTCRILMRKLVRAILFNSSELVQLII